MCFTRHLQFWYFKLNLIVLLYFIFTNIDLWLTLLCCRLSKSTVHLLLELLQNCPELKMELNHGGRKPVELEKQVLITLWILANTCCFRDISDRFNVTKSSIYRIFRRICSAIVSNLVNRFIRFPTGNGIQQVCEGFQKLAGIPRVLGAVDGCHIPIKAPSKFPENYVNRKKFHSVVLQGICDHNLMFLDVYCGWPGSVHDARILRNSDIGQKAYSNPTSLFPPETYLLGDSAYPLLPWLITPFKRTTILSARQKRFNKKHSCTRNVIERSFGLLKSRFRKLTCMDFKTGDIPMIVTAATVLHNMCLLSGDHMTIEDDINEEVNGFDNVYGDNIDGQSVRTRLMELVLEE